MVFDNPKVYGDTSISNDLVLNFELPICKSNILSRHGWLVQPLGGGSKSSRPDGWRLAALVFGHLSALDRMTFIVVQYLQYSATCFNQISDLLQALDN
jgi:hypothetical protein